MKPWMWVAVIVAVIVLALSGWLWGRYHPDPDIVGQMAQAMMAESVKQYEGRIASLTKEALDAKRLSDARLAAITTKLDTLIARKDNVKPPETADIDTRLDALGLTPVGRR